MKIGYLPDTHGGPYDQPEPTREATAQFCDQLLNEGIVAEHAGFDGIFLPERHHRTETMFPPLEPAPERVIECIKQFGAEVIPHCNR
jgi:alkanesulfonate monooxygenase SsuD/methylene tetrahydromethanopterin reductase-like flavin-dependent oxidoreductase (luciferase family)